MSSNDIDIDQKELFKNANRRLRQKKRLVHHLVFFIAGGVMLMFVNLVLNYGRDFTPIGMPWYVSVIIIWAVFLLAHAINVFFVEKLMGRAWEEKYMAKLVEKQLAKLKKLQQKVDEKYPLDEPKPGDTAELENKDNSKKD
jgi:hypothetical protein